MAYDTLGHREKSIEKITVFLLQHTAFILFFGIFTGILSQQTLCPNSEDDHVIANVCVPAISSELTESEYYLRNRPSLPVFLRSESADEEADEGGVGEADILEIHKGSSLETIGVQDPQYKHSKPSLSFPQTKKFRKVLSSSNSVTLDLNLKKVV